MCVFFSHAYASSSDDPDFFKNRYQYSNWSHDKVTPYNTAGSTQPDYYNSSKYNVSSSRDVTTNGSKYKQTVNVAVEVSKAEKLATIANRAKNYAKYAKEFGKASLPSMVGSAAIYGLIEGIGWVMDDGGNISVRNPVFEDTSYSNLYQYNCGGKLTDTYTSCGSAYISKCVQDDGDGCGLESVVAGSCYVNNGGLVGCSFNIKPYFGGGQRSYNAGIRVNRETTVEESVPVSPDEISDQTKKAIENNNSALSSAIAQAIKDAFSESELDKDPQTGAKTNPIADKTKKALDEKGATELAEKADPTVCVPNIGDLEGMCTNMPKSEADALPTLTCVNRPIVSANSCVYEADPNAPPKTGTVDKPKVDPETGDLPDACVWFDVHCKWLEWTKDDDLSDDTELDLDHQNEPESNTEIAFDGLCPANKVVQLPAPFNFEMTFSYEPYCLVAEKIKPAVVACGLFISALILGGIKGSD